MFLVSIGIGGGSTLPVCGPAMMVGSDPAMMIGCDPAMMIGVWPCYDGRCVALL